MTTPVTMTPSVALPVTRSTVTAAGTAPTTQAKQSILDRFIPSGSSGMVDSATMLGRLGNAANTAVKGGQEALPNVQGAWGALKSFDLTKLWSSAQALGKTALTWGTRSALFQGAISLVANGYRSMTGRQSWGDTGTKVVMDTTTGMVGGAAGAVAGGIGTMALTALGVAGGPLTIGAALIGMGGYFLGESFFKSTSIYKRINKTVSTIMHDALRPFSN
ncbi:MAG TPA: hypothetical protein V6D05_15985 [Stenomitos sp.]